VDTGVQPSLKVPSELALTVDVRAERVASARRQTFCTDVHRFTFATLFGGGTVEVAGEPPVVSPSSRWSGLRTRLALSSMITLLGIAGVIALSDAYIGRHIWYARHGDIIPLLGFGSGASLLLGVALAFVMLARAARSWFAIGISAGAAAAFGLGVFLAYTYKNPSAEIARSELAGGNLLRAQEEAQALVDLGRDATGGGAVLDDLHLRKARDLQSLPELIASVRAPWHEDGARMSAETILRTRVQDLATHLYTTHDVSGLELLENEIGTAVPTMSDGVRWLLAVVRGGALLEAADTAAAPAQLDAVVKLAVRVPQSMRPDETLQINAIATTLGPALVATNAKSAKERIKAIAAAVGPAREYARLVGMDSNSVAQGFARRQKEAALAALRADLWAKQRAERARNSSNASPPSREAAANVPIDPYAVRSAPVDGESSQEQDKRQ